MKSIIKNKIKILLATPGEEAEGGIASVVMGLEKVLELMSGEMVYKKILYAKPKRGLNKLQRSSAEILQLFNFIGTILFFNPHIIHIQSSFDKKTILRDSIHLLITRFFRKKFVLHAHGGEWHLITNWNKLWLGYANWFLTRCHRIIVTSTEEQKIIKNQYGHRVNVSKIYNPVINPINPSDCNDMKTSSPIKKIIFASRFIETKGILDAIRSTSFLQRNDFKLLLFGEGQLLNQAKSIIMELKMQDTVTLMGEIPLEELIKQYMQSDIFIFPSYHLEGFPMAFFYAVTCGMAIITTKVRPITDFLSEPDNCLWIDSQNPKMLAEKIDYLLDHAELRQQMSDNNKKLATLFSVEKIADQLEEVYTELNSK